MDKPSRFFPFYAVIFLTSLLASAPLSALDIDPSAPDGIRIGMQQADAEDLLLKNGYKKLALCRYSKSNAGNLSSVSLLSGRRCEEDKPVSEITYRTELPKETAPPPETLVEEIQTVIKDEKTCAGLNKDSAICDWAYPKTLPLVEKIHMTYGTSGTNKYLNLTLNGIKNLEDHMQTQAGKAPSKAMPDPLKPFGIHLGMAASEAKNLMKENGFRGNRGGDDRPCQYLKGGVTLYFATGPAYKDCHDAEPISHFEYNGLDMAAPPLNYLSHAEQSLGEPTRCSSRQKNYFSCQWTPSPKAPLVKIARINGQSALHGDIFAVADMASRTATATPPAHPANTIEWWEKELAKTEELAKKSKFTGSERYATLSRDEQQRLKSEAERVYDSCKKRGLFSSLRECRCVAGKFIDARLIKEEEKRITDAKVAKSLEEACKADAKKCPPEPKADSELTDEERFRKRRKENRSSSIYDLIAIADEVAHQCPNKPGAARFAFKKCMDMYQIKMDSDAELKTFCNCYTEEFVQRFMQEPGAGLALVTTQGRLSAEACKKKGMPSPF